MAERSAYTRDEILSMVICHDVDDMEHFEPGSDDELGFNSDVCWRTVIYKYECVNHLCKHSYVIFPVNDAI